MHTSKPTFELIDLFEQYDRLPKKINSILNKYGDSVDTYGMCEKMQKELNAVGYTFDYYLTADPYHLRKYKPETIQECVELLVFMLAAWQDDEETQYTEEENNITLFLEAQGVEWIQEGSEYSDWALKATDQERALEMYNRLTATR